MRITEHSTDGAILAELGARLAWRRIDSGVTQAELAKAAGVSKRSVERIEAGRAAELPTLIRVLRSLALGDELDALVPAAPAQSRRQRVARRKAKAAAAD